VTSPREEMGGEVDYPLATATSREGKGSRLGTILKSEVLMNETWKLFMVLVNGLAQPCHLALLT
jgi:hypothetical protein